MTQASRTLLSALAAALLLATRAPAQDQQAPSVYEQPQQPPAYGQPAYGAPAGAPPQQQFGPAAPPTVGQLPLVPPGAQSGQPGAPAGPVVQPLAPPFQLSEVEHTQVYRLLEMWEKESAKVKTFSAKFQRQEYDAVWGPGADKAFVISDGTLSYSKPDKGSFKIDGIRRWEKVDPKNAAEDAPKDYVQQKDEVGEHWVCDGKAVYEYNHEKKQLVVTPIPEEMRGVSIVDGPLPFLFGAEAAKLDQRYWIRERQSDAASIWLEAYPRRQGDAANYQHVDVMLDRKTMQPTAMQVYLPAGQQKHVYVFSDPVTNGKLDWFSGLFAAPRTPLGWTKIVAQEPEPLQPGPNAQSATAPAAQPR